MTASKIDKEFEFKVIDKINSKIISIGFHNFCKLGVMTENGNPMYVKGLENDIDFIFESAK